MNRSRVKSRSRGGFTIVEILVVIAIIGILATISIVSYGAWRRSVTAATIKSDLNGVIAAMESYRTFNNGYPGSVPSSFTPSEGVLLSGGSADAKTYCVEATSADDASLVFYAASEVKDKGPQEGACADRVTLPLPSVPGNLAVASAIGTTVDLSWSAVADVATYNVQCASDAAFILGMRSASPAYPATSATVSDLSPSNTYYCRIRAVNAAGASAWSPSVSTTTTSNYGSLAVATSIEGYWTSAPQGFLLEDGAAVSRTTYADLFAVIGTTYGAGNGSTTFNLPDSRGRTSVNLNPSDTEFDTLGEKPGSKTEALTIAQIPSHTHTQSAHNHTQNAHAHTVSDPSHNHAQNAHSHSYSATPDNNAMGLCCGGQTGWALYPGANNAIFRLIFTSTTATNNAATTGVSYANVTATNQSTVGTNQNTGSNEAHNNIQPSIVKLSAIKYAPIEANAATLPAGSSIQGYWVSAPTGYLFEDGAAYSRTTESALFAAIGTTYGSGDGSTTFNVPDSRGRVAVNRNSADTEFDAMGEKTGSKVETLTIAQIPSHTHTQSAHNHTQNAHTHTVTNPSHNHTQDQHRHEARSSSNGDYVGMENGTQGGWGFGIYSAANNNIYRMAPTSTTATNVASTTGVGIYSTTSTNQNTTAWNQNTGGGGSHNNIQPSIVKKYAIKTTAATTSGTQLVPGTSISGYWSSAPAGYLVEDGSLKQISDYRNLFAVIGTTYGGDGTTTFALPDSRGWLSVNRNPSDTTFDVIGEKTGSKTESLTVAQLPSHTHTQDAHSHTQNPHGHTVYDSGHNHAQNPHTHEIRNTQNGDFAGMTNGSQGGWGISNPSVNSIFRFILNYTTATNDAASTSISLGSTATVNQSTSATNQNTGGGGSHNNIQPSIVKLYVIKY